MGKLLGLFTGAMGGIWGYVAAFGFGIALATAGTWYVVGNAKDVEIGGLKLAASQKATADVTASLSQLQGFIAAMHVADSNYNGALAAIDARFISLERQWKNATAKPLPLDCKPDLPRQRMFTDAVNATHAQSAPAATP